MTTIFWISLGLSAARWAWTEFQRWRDKGVIALQAETIQRQASEISALKKIETVFTKKKLLRALPPAKWVD